MLCQIALWGGANPPQRRQCKQHQEHQQDTPLLTCPAGWSTSIWNSTQEGFQDRNASCTRKNSKITLCLPALQGGAPPSGTVSRTAFRAEMQAAPGAPARYPSACLPCRVVAPTTTPAQATPAASAAPVTPPQTVAAAWPPFRAAPSATTASLKGTAMTPTASGELSGLAKQLTRPAKRLRTSPFSGPKT